MPCKTPQTGSLKTSSLAQTRTDTAHPTAPRTTACHRNSQNRVSSKYAEKEKNWIMNWTIWIMRSNLVIRWSFLMMKSRRRMIIWLRSSRGRWRKLRGRSLRRCSRDSMTGLGRNASCVILIVKNARGRMMLIMIRIIRMIYLARKNQKRI